MTETEFNNILTNDIKKVEHNLLSFLPDCKDGQESVVQAMEYSLINGGKRLRPVFALEFANACGSSKEDALPLACAMEYIHTYSLIHDDLPCMDNDDLRRGKPSCHKAFGEDTALLAGDALLNYAYETAWKAFPLEEHTDRVVRAFGILCQKTGISGMLGGQSVDVMNEKAGHFAIDREMLDYIYENKTSALLEAAMMAGAALAGANGDDLDALCRIASKVGIAFQIRDDMLDVVGDAAVFGKPIGSDKEEGKITFVDVLGLDGCLAQTGRSRR